MTRVLFVCLQNAGRSQMSAALFRRAAGGRHECESAGSRADPEGEVHPRVIEAMEEVGIDLRSAKPKRLTESMVERADLIVTMGCGDQCPVFPGKRYLDWNLPDPGPLGIEEVRTIRDEIGSLVGELIRELDAQPQFGHGPEPEAR